MIGAGLFRGFVAQINAVLGTLAASAGAGLVGFVQAAATAVARTVQAKLRETVSVADFGAVGDGVTDDTAAIQAAFTAAAAGAEVVFPWTANGYKIADNINVPAGVHLAGPGKVLRTHGLAVSNYAFTLNGGNKVRGLAYDGGALTIGAPGSPLSIKDFRCIGNEVEFSGCSLINSCGSFIDFSNDQHAVADSLSGLVVRGNAIGDYLDHAIYCQGYNLVPTGRITIGGNSFIGTAGTTTRQAIKLKNIAGAAVTGNAINLPNGIFVVVETGLDAPEVAADCRDVSITGNVGACVKFLESVAALDAANQAFMLRNLAVTGNAVTCTGYVLSLGLVADGATSYATRANGVLIAGNTFVGAFGININADKLAAGIDNLAITGNNITVTGAPTVLNLWGDVRGLIFANNTCTMSAAYAAGNAVWNNANIVGASGQPAYAPAVSGVFDISENTLLGNFGCLVAEQPASGITALNMTVVLRGNRNISANASKRELVLTSTALATATALFHLEGNLSVGGTTAANVCAVQALLTGELRIGSGSTGLVVRPNTGNNGVSLYASGVTPDATNFALQSTGALGILNGTTSSLLQVGNSTKLAASASGVAVTGALASGNAASTLASAGTIAPDGLVHFVSGVTTISTITPPANMATKGGIMILIPTGAWTMNTAGNIAANVNAVVGKPLLLVWDVSSGGRWYPAY